MHFFLSSTSVVYVLTTPMPEDGGDNPTNVKISKELWDTLEAKYMVEDVSSKKFFVNNFTNYKMTDSRPVLEQYNELLGIHGRFIPKTTAPYTLYFLSVGIIHETTAPVLHNKMVDMTKEFLSLKFSMKDMGEADVILVRTPMDTCEKMMLNNGQVVSQLDYSRVIGCLMYSMTYTRLDIAFDVGKLSSNTEDNSSTSGWVFILGGDAISWASKKQTCITGSTIESEFVALVAAGKKAEWFKNLLLEIPLWVKPITSISIPCDSVATLENTYIQMYNEKSRHLGVIHFSPRLPQTKTLTQHLTHPLL
nr:hypothetical protein [Tanacetum cinerariifolium]